MSHFLQFVYHCLCWMGISFLVFSLAACGVTPAQPTPTLPLTPSDTPNPTQTASLTPTLTATLTPSRTASPTKPSSTPTITPTANWKTRLAPTQTIPLAVEVMTDFGTSKGWSYSPNGSWLLEDLSFDLSLPQDPVLRVIRADGNFDWRVALPKTSGGSDTYRLAAWAHDQKFLYLEHRIRRGTDMPGLCGPDEILRLKLDDGTLMPFVSFDRNPSGGCWDYAFSDDAGKLAYTSSDTPRQLVVLDLTNGQKRTASLDAVYSNANWLRWSPDQDQLLVLASQPGSPAPVKSTLFWVKIENTTLTMREVFSQPGFIFVQEWQGERVLVSPVAEFKANQPYWEVSLGDSIRVSTGSNRTPLPPRPIRTVTPTLPTRTPMHIPSRTPSATYAPTSPPPVIVRTDMPNAYSSNWQYSPNKQWVVEGMDYSFPTMRGAVLFVISVDGKVRWKVDFLGESARPSAYRPVLWSKDGNFLYIEYRKGFRDGGPGVMYCGPDGLMRLDLRNGSIEPFPAFSQIGGCWDYDFSPDLSKIVYVPPSQPKQLVILDIDSGKKLAYPLDPSYDLVGDLYWWSGQQILAVAIREAKNQRSYEGTLLRIKIEGDSLDVQNVFTQAGFVTPLRVGKDRVVVGQSYSISEENTTYWAVYLDSKVAIEVDPEVEFGQ